MSNGVPETRYARTSDGLHVAYQTIGEGPRNILLLPFVGCIDLMWEDPGLAHVLHRLARTGRLIAFDYRGTGSSDAMRSHDPSETEGYEPFIDDVRVVLDEVGAETVNVVAHGTAGAKGILFAASYPARTQSLVLVDTWARSAWAEDYPWGVTTEVLDAMEKILEEGWGTGDNVWFQAPSHNGDEAFRRWLGRYERGIGGPTTAAAGWRTLIVADVRAVLPSIQAPTLVLHKDKAMVPLEHGRYLAEHIPGARLEVLAGSDNLFFTEAIDDFVDHVEEFVTGMPAVRDPERALATVMFTDVVASTDHASRLGDRRWAALLDQHDAIVRRELARHRGQRVKTTGDGILATFDGPARGIRCAQAIIGATAPLGIQVRAGLHTGEVELRDEDIGGIAVHIGQRISALAKPGEVLVSRTVTDLVVGSGLEFDDRGDHELKGVPGVWRLFAVVG